MTDLAVQIQQLQGAIVLLIAGTIIAIGYILTLPIPEYRKADDPTCPLHKCPRSKCRPEWHE